MAKISAIVDTGFVVADACIVHLSELHPDHVVVMTDARDFRVYRRFRR